MSFFRRIAKENLIQKCSLCKKDKRLEVHHIDFNRKNNKLSNLTILCKSCHSKIHKRDKNINDRRKIF
jgi:5-methylcytosine-specific restriction endonuclease McrA